MLAAFPNPPTGSRRVSRALAACCLALVLGACSAEPEPADSPRPTGPRTSKGPGGVTRPTVVPSNLPECKFPPSIETPEWMPTDLPFPAGTYTMQLLPDATSYHRAILVVPGSLQTFIKFVLSDWPKAGWILGRGESEPGEVEDQFQKAPAVGAFKAVSVYCKPGFSKMLIVYAEQNPGLPGLPSPTGTGTAINPSASP
ncbi:MAG TPA: hypothetical protein VGB19_06240 [Actinomycetota bacterium]